MFLAVPAFAQDWPSWRGPNGSGSADFGATLVTNVSDAKLLWKSEDEDIPMGWLGAGSGAQGIVGGYGSPVVSGGRVYLAYYVPSGEVVDEKSLAAAKDKRPEKWKVDADDVILCLDAQTGKTLWKTAIKGKGGNNQYHSHGPFFQTAIAGGRVFLSGSGGWLYCMDAVTGEEVWTSRLGKVTEWVEQSKALKVIMCPGDGGTPVNKVWFNGCPAVAEGVVAASDYQGGIVGFAVADGKRLWAVANCISALASSPTIWTHQGKSYFIAAGPERAVAVEPKTGKELWEIKPWVKPSTEPVIPWRDLESGKPFNTNQYTRLPKPQQINVQSTPAVSGDYLLMQPGNDQGTGKGEWRGANANQMGMACFRMSLKGTQLLWAHGPEQGGVTWGSPLIYGAYAYGQTGASKRGAHGARVKLEAGEVVTPDAGIGAGLVSPIASDGRIVQEGSLFLAEGDEFRRLGNLKINLMEFTMPSIADGRLYCRGDNGKGDKLNPRCAVYCYDLRVASKPQGEDGRATTK